MNRIRSLANKLRLDKQEKPNNASVKKNTPTNNISESRREMYNMCAYPICFGILGYHFLFGSELSKI